MNIEGVEYEVVVEVYDRAQDYEWSAANLLRDPQGRLYFYADSGCSCNMNMEAVFRSDLIPVESWQQAAARVSEPDKDHWFSVYSVHREDFRAACREAVKEGRL